MPPFLRWWSAVLVGIAFVSACAPPPALPPNIVFILADDLGYMDVGAYNPATFYETPHLDRLALEGMRFTAGYAASPVCSPTRASIMTGKYPARTDMTDWFGAPQPETASQHWTRDQPLLPAPYVDQLPHEETTLAEALREGGYRTFFAGKWHLGREGSYPEDHGFEVNRGGWERGGPYGGGKYFSPYGNPRLTDGPEGEHLPDRLAQETVQFMADHRDQPFLAYLSFYSVHTPLMGRPDLVAKYEARQADASADAWGEEGTRQVRLVQNHAVYAAMVEAMDEAVGRVLTALDSLGLAQNTVVFFMSDNGGLSTSEGHPTSNLPLRAGKGWLYEGGIREPWIVRWPGTVAPGSTIDVPVISTDFYPTILEAVGLPLRPTQHRDGHSLVPLLKGIAPPPRDTLYWHYPHYGNQGGSPGTAIRVGPLKLISFYGTGHVELYNLALDPGETRDLSAIMAPQAQSLKAALDAWYPTVDAKHPRPNE